MRTTFRVPTLAIFALFIPACQPPAQEMAPARSAEQVQADMEAMRTTWLDLANAGDAAGVAALYTDDVVYLDPYGGVHRGRAAVEGYYTQSLARSSGWELQIEESVTHGDMVAGYGTWSGTAMAPEGAAPMSGMWHNVSVYQPDGSLQIRFSLAMLPAEPPPEM
jgi:uncharacterized protein (TIGR02246 family)